MSVEWNGEGLPPVGCVCEVKGCMSHYLKWNKVTVFAVRGKTVFFDMDDGRWGQTESHEFRPIRTEAERRRDDAIAAMRNFATNYNNTAVIHAIEKVYESIAAGKIPGIRLTDDAGN